MSSELIAAGQPFMPALSVPEAAQRRGAIVDFVREVMQAGVDFGCIPGTPKPTLLKPGAEKLCALFGLTARFQILHCVEDWTGAEHQDEPFFYYLYRCQLWRDARLIAESDGSCNSREQKYRWRDAQRLCPLCGVAAIIRGRAEYGGGWLCFVRKGGCGAKFADGDAGIEAQTVGRVPNPDVADQVNTIQKMAQKRALVCATLLAVNASEFFTQDEEDRAAPQEATLPNKALEADAAPLVVVEFVEVPTEQAPPVGEESRVSAAQARGDFERRAREEFGYAGDARGMAQLAVLLLGGRPARWTAQTWQTAARQPDAEWQAAMRTLRNARQA